MVIPAIIAVWVPNRTLLLVAAVFFFLPAIAGVFLLIIPFIGIFTAPTVVWWYWYALPRLFPKNGTDQKE